MITEPVTMATDYVLAAACLWFAVTLPSRMGRYRLWFWAFLVTSLAAVLGGTAHGFWVLLGDYGEVVWTSTVVGIVASAVLLIPAGVRAAQRSDPGQDQRRPERLQWLERAVLVTLIALALLVLRVSIHQHLNHNDLYHVVQTGGLYCLARAARLDIHPEAAGRST